MAAFATRVLGPKYRALGRRTTTINERKCNIKDRRNRFVVKSYLSISSPLKEEYEILKVSPGASEKDIKRAFRQLALQYHPDVCKGDNCEVSFHKINLAYEALLSNTQQKQQKQNYNPDNYMEDMMGVNMDCWDEWEEWMGWEGAGTLDYTNHINSYA